MNTFEDEGFIIRQLNDVLKAAQIEGIPEERIGKITLDADGETIITYYDVSGGTWEEAKFEHTPRGAMLVTYPSESHAPKEKT